MWDLQRSTQDVYHMLWVERFIKALFPTLVLEETPWQSEWESNQRKIFLRIMRVFLPLIALGYVLHYFFFDKPNQLQPADSWFLFRMSMATIVVAAFLFYISPLSQTKWYKLPAVLITGLGAYAQANVTYYYPAAPWIYPFVFLLASSLMLRLSVFHSLLYAAVTIAFFLPVLVSAGVDIGTLVSACVVVVIVIGVTRSSYSFEITNFLLNKTNAAQQAANLELQQEFSDRIKSFIPRVIANRIQSQMNSDNSGVMEASLSVLRAKKKHIACLFSDIRGFTQGSKNLNEFINESVMPEVKASSEKIEDFEGIPRKIGDLIFAYFDDDSIEMNIIRATLAGMELSQMNKDFNETVSTVEIRRYILISSGEAIVGNLGGIDSAVEITALGSPVNFLSRLDDATKEKNLAALLEPGDIIMSSDSATILARVQAQIDIKEISLDELGIEIRDFPETRKLFVMKASQKNRALLRDLYSSNTCHGSPSRVQESNEALIET